MKKTHFVYTMWNTETREAIYVGCTNNLARRMNQHRREHPYYLTACNWIAAVPFADEAEAFHEEAVRIGKLLPRYNRASSWRHMRVLKDFPNQSQPELTQRDWDDLCAAVALLPPPPEFAA